jgi:hypothetical protein
MGFMSVSRCCVCHGNGAIPLSTLPEVVLYEWMEGYLDEDTDDEWLEIHLKRLIKIRAKRREALALGQSPDDDDD